jgi:hypothetical protein
MSCRHVYYFYPDRKALPMCKKHYRQGIWCVNDLFKSQCPFREQAEDAKTAPPEEKEAQIDPIPEAPPPPEPVIEPEGKKENPTTPDVAHFHKRGRPAKKK